MYRHEILENRKKVVAFLQESDRKKAEGILDNGDDSRCCLGHMCHVLSVKTEDRGGTIFYGDQVAVAPEELREMVGLRDEYGSANTSALYVFGLQVPEYGTMGSLVDLNDCTSATPQEIGAYLESVIHGGDDTPWKSLSEYPEKKG
jgi:hypothetical protein